MCHTPRGSRGARIAGSQSAISTIASSLRSIQVCGPDGPAPTSLTTSYFPPPHSGHTPPTPSTYPHPTHRPAFPRHRRRTAPTANHPIHPRAATATGHAGTRHSITIPGTSRVVPVTFHHERFRCHGPNASSSRSVGVHINCCPRKTGGSSRRYHATPRATPIRHATGASPGSRITPGLPPTGKNRLTTVTATTPTHTTTPANAAHFRQPRTACRTASPTSTSSHAPRVDL